MTWSESPVGGSVGRRARTAAVVARTVLAVLAAAGLPLISACRRAQPEGFVLRQLVEAHAYAVGSPAAAAPAAAGLRFTSPPAAADVEVDHERRPVVVTTAEPWSWSGRVPPAGRLHASLQLVPGAWQAVRRVQALATVRAGHDREVVQVVRSAERVNPVWLDLSADLGHYAGRLVTLELSVTLVGMPSRLRGAKLVAWGPVALTGSTSPGRGAAGSTAGTSAGASAEGGGGNRGGRPPNVIVILVDTLRRDRLTPYGYRRETSPQIARWLAAAGTVVEDAYSQAPWTLPSVVSLLTGRHPGELLASDPSTYGIPRGVQPLAERLSRAGFETAGFLANPTLHVGAGFERGFRTFYAPPADVEWLRRHAEDVNRHALPWIAAYQDQERPFFLYLHYIDPHDPYANPETAGNRSPFEEAEYNGPVTGEWVHPIWTGRMTLPDPPRDVAHLSALYDSEVHYVDGRIGELLAGLRPEVLARTLVVLTADHGEELDDHGGWKHGQTLYDEQIHVPLIWRWDGHVAAGRRLAGTVRLLDVAPTVAAATGIEPDPGWEGLDLLPALRGTARLPERPAFAEGLSSGPLRAAAVLGRLKLMVFNREEPFAPADEIQAHLWRQDLGRLARIELYDLAHDPGERRNLAAAGNAPADPGRIALLSAVIDGHLDRSLTGLRLLAAGIPRGSQLHLALSLAAPPRGWQPFLLAPTDRVSLAGNRLSLDLVGGDPLARGVRIAGDFGAAAAPAVLDLAATLDGRPLSPAEVRVGAGSSYGGGPLTVAALRARSRRGEPAAGGAGALAATNGPAVRIWLHDPAGEPERRSERDPETERRLRALGYIQ
jgi:arylsulfatase A-like enzyme